MGQRILISEEDKKHIKKLYEAETAPPPDESVLVAKKNPFKYPEYESARRVYSADLKDGDLFYKNVNNYPLTDFLDEFNLEFLKNLKDKTVRHNDKIYTIIGLANINEEVTFLGKGHEIGTVVIKKSDSPEMIPYSVFLKWDYQYRNVNLFFEAVENYYGYDNFSSSLINDLYEKKYREDFVEKHKEQNRDDKYFEIRKIQRRQTDF